MGYFYADRNIEKYYIIISKISDLKINDVFAGIS